MTLRGQGDDAVKRIHEGVAAMREAGAHQSEPMVLGVLAEALALKGAVADGLRALAAALAAADATGTHWADAELYRLRGGLLGRLPSVDWAEVERCFRTALTIARKQGTRGFELRTAVELARLSIAQHRRDEACDILRPIYARFTEGFDTPDLKEAKALLGGVV